MRKNLISFAAAATMAWAPGCLFGAPKVSSLAGMLIEEGYTPLMLKRAGNEFYVSCKLNGRSASLVVDTGAGQTVIASGLLKSLGLPLRKGEENVYGMMGWAGKNIQAGEIKDFQVGPYQAGAHPVRRGISRPSAANLEPRAWMVSWESIFSTVTKQLSIASECTFFSNLPRRHLLRQR